MKTLCLATLVLVAVANLGCRADVETTEDSTKLELEGPRVETGSRPLDLNPGTDDDLDVDTPAPGDR
jgi:hypothetical protein